MANLDPAAFARQPSGDIHQTAEIAGEQDRRAAFLGSFGLFIDDRGGDFAILYGERASEAAAARVIVHFDKIEPAHRAQKFARLRSDAQFAQAGASVMIGDAARKFGIDAKSTFDLWPASLS